MGEAVLLDEKAVHTRPGCIGGDHGAEDASRARTVKPAGGDRVTQETTVASHNAFSKRTGPKPFYGQDNKDDPSRCHGPARISNPLRSLVAATSHSAAREAAGLVEVKIQITPVILSVNQAFTAESRCENGRVVPGRAVLNAPAKTNYLIPAWPHGLSTHRLARRRRLGQSDCACPETACRVGDPPLAKSPQAIAIEKRRQAPQAAATENHA